MKALRELTRQLAVAGILSWSSTASAAWLAFDFDEDDNPATIRNEIEAGVGDLIEGYLVLGGFPTEFDYLDGAMFGLDMTSGLEFRGLAVAID
jgi:hypothetical protein